MGNSGLFSSSDSLASCLLSKQEFMKLKVGSQFDHRDYEGRFTLAQVVQKKRGQSRTQIYINYVGWDNKYNTWVDYNAAPFDFAKAGSVSQRAASGPLKYHNVTHIVAYCPNPNDSKCDWRPAQITSVDHGSGQVYVVYAESGKNCGRWVHLDNQFEIDVYDSLTTKSSSLGSASSDSLESCLLSENEFMALQVGSRFDHRDYQGLFALAQVVKRNKQSPTKIYIHYVGWNDQYDVWVDYTAAPFNFARAESVSQRAASGPLQHYDVGHNVAYCPNPSDSTCKWRPAKIISVDADSGQVRITYRRSGRTVKRYVHLDNQYEIDVYESLKTQQNKNNNNQNGSKKKNRKHPHGNNNNGWSNNNMHNGHCSGGQHQMQRQSQMQRQDQMTVRTQLLLDDTHKQLRLTRNYLDAAAQAKCNKEGLSTYNQKVVVGLTCFRMKVSGMRKNAKAEGLDFNDAFKSSSMVIKQFEREFRAQYGSNQFLMQRLEPCLNYMRAVLKGDADVPPLPYVNEYEFNANVASSVISSVAHAQNHVIPDRVKEIAKDNEQYKSHQQQLRQQYEEEESGGSQKTNKIDYRHLIQDFNTNNIAFGDSKAKQQQIIDQQQEAFKYEKPNLMDGDGDQCDHDMEVLPSQNQESPDVDMY